MSDQKTLKDSPNVTSSRELGDGVEHYNSQDGVQTDLLGQEVLHAKHSAQQEAEKERMTSDTSGQCSLILSESANLQQSLASRLQQLSDLDGSMIYKTTLKQKATPQQRLYFHLAASARTTKGTDSSLPPSAWPTPSTRDHKGGYKGGRIRNGKISTDTLDVAAQLCGQTQPSSTAETESTVPSQLNPRFSLWLMGYPIEWAYSGERVTPLSRKRQQKS